MTAENFDMEELLQYVEERKFRLLRSRLAEMNEADIAEFMEELDDNKKVLIFRMLPKDQAADAFAFLEPDIQQHIINSITDAEVSKIIEDLFVDCLLYTSTLNLFMHFAFLGENAAPVGIAMIHTIFNVTVTLVLLPFNQMLVKLAYVVIPVTDDEKSKNSGKLTILDERFLEVPGYALEISETAALTMFQEVRRSLGMSETLIKNYQPDTVVEMKDSEELVDGYENQISNYLLALSHKGINEAESQKLSVLLYTVNDIETISDQVCNIGIAYRGLDAKENAFSEMALDELSVLQELETELVDKTIEMFHAKGETMLDVYACRHLLLDLSGKVKERHMFRLIKNKCSMEVGIVLTDILNSYERISLRCLRIANYLSQKDKKSLTIHDLETMLPESEYHAEYEQYKAKYQLA